MLRWISIVLICVSAGSWIRSTYGESQLNSKTNEKERHNLFVPAAAPTNLRVKALRYQESNHLQLNISWDASTEGKQATSFNVHVSAVEDSESRCDTEPYYAFIEDPNTTTWVIQPKGMVEVNHHDSSFTVLPGCSYEIRLEANPHDGKTYAQTNYYVPDCVEEVCTCRHAKNLSAPTLKVECNKNTVHITWSRSEAQNISKFILRAGPLLHHGEQAGLYNLSWRVEQPVTSELQYHLRYKAPGPGKYAVQLRAADTHQCYGPERQLEFMVSDYTTNDEETVYKSRESQLNSKTNEKERHYLFVPAAAPTNLRVKALPFQKSNRLQLNISWDASTEGRRATSFNVHVSAIEDSESRCDTEPYYAFVEDPNTTTWVIHPKAMEEVNHHDSSFTVLPGCSYEVRVEANPHDGKTYAQTNYHVPDCVEEVCTCWHAKNLSTPKLRVESNKNIVHITWSRTEAQNIAKFILRVGPALHLGDQAGLYNLSWRAEQPVTSELQYHLRYEAPSPGKYAVQLRAVDTRQCYGPERHLVFMVSDYTNIDEETVYKNRLFWIILLPSVVMILLVYLLFGLVWRTSQKWVESQKEACNFKQRVSYRSFRVKSERVFRKNDSLQERNILYVEKEIEEAKARGEVDGYEISCRQLTYLREIGRGAFGQVYLAKGEAIRGVPGSRMVAVKRLKVKANREEREEFLEEIAMLKRVGRHPNIVSLLGCCTLRSDVCMVMEYVPCGDLLNYLRGLRRSLAVRKTSVTSSDTSSSSPSTVMTSLNSTCSSNHPPHDYSGVDKPIDHRELHNFALQIAQGMAHLEMKRITHRDLAARNILIDNTKMLKISDFGLSRKGVYINTRRRKVPLRWLSVEAIRDALYSSKSDVWAFAIVLWEIGTLGGFPYPTVSDFDLLRFLEQGNRLEKPDIVSQNLYSVMQVCWSDRPDDRPSFAELVSYLRPDLNRHVYVEVYLNTELPPTSPDPYVNTAAPC